VEFYDVPRCIALRYGKRLFLLQSAFDEGLDDYESSYSIYENGATTSGGAKLFQLKQPTKINPTNFKKTDVN